MSLPAALTFSVIKVYVVSARASAKVVWPSLTYPSSFLLSMHQYRLEVAC